MTLTVTSVNGGLGFVVFGSDGKPAHVATSGPLSSETILVGDELTTEPAITPVLITDLSEIGPILDELTIDLSGLMPVWISTAPVP